MKYITSPLLLSKPKDREQLFIYLSISKTTVNAVFIWKEEGRQLLVYYVSKSLLDSETCYSQLDKLALALVTAGHKLRLHFQCHPIVVLTTFPFKGIHHKP